MGSAHLPKILEKLLHHGLPAYSPMAAIRCATRVDQQSIVTTVAEAVRDPEAVMLGSPSLYVIGRVAALGESLNWFETRPLFGARVVLTRPEGAPRS
jgi:uroporphyrinogen III methyltransferase/synthase